MYYRISDHIALRSWKYVHRAYYAKNRPYANGLTEEQFNLMLLCDGEHDIEPDELTKDLEESGLIKRCNKGEHSSEWSTHKTYNNRYFPKMNFMITGKCNYNCLHCFNAADNAPLMTEWSFDEVISLLDQARDCGVNAFTITGGEPMLHPRFMDILSEIHKRGMYVEELNTNGYFITQEILDRMKDIDCIPYIKISFDGIGCHDWMRDKKGAEQKTLEAMELCVKNGFRVMSQTQVHRRNLHTLMDTARKLNEIGVSTLRLIRTTEVPRWEKNAPDSCLSFEEYFEKMLDFISEYKNSRMYMNIIAWQLLEVYPISKSYNMVAVSSPTGDYSPTTPICRGNRGMIGVTSSGDIIPCLQMSGYFEEHNIHLGNLHNTPLSELLSDGPYLKLVCANLHKLRKNNQKCDECRFFKYCNGGCPALGRLYSPERDDLYGSDVTKCLFYEKGWYQKCSDALSGWRNNSAIEEFENNQI